MIFNPFFIYFSYDFKIQKTSDATSKSRYVQKDVASFSLIWGGLAIRREGDLAVHRQQYFVYMIFDDQLVKILHHPKVMHNQD